ncbi:MAG: ferritin-like domain-containing protein [Polyangiaceae bacterium]
MANADEIFHPSREHLLHCLYEAAELEHNLMCTYLYAAFSLRDGESEGLSIEEALAVTNWRRALMRVAVEEMGHLAAVWNITSALGGAPRFGRTNFPLDAGVLPAGVVVKLAPFNEASLQHFIYLERPHGSLEPEGPGFASEFAFARASERRVRLTPMPVDYDTVGEFYAKLEQGVGSFVAAVGESNAFAGDPALQLSAAEVGLSGARPVICSKTALAAFTAIVEQGEGAPEHSFDSHFQRFIAVREELSALKQQNPEFSPAFPAATNPLLRPPMRPGPRVWLENPEAVQTVDLANTGYAVMLRLLAYAYQIPRPDPEKALAVDLSLGLMRAVTRLGEHAARLPAGPSHPACNAGMSFTALRDSAAFPAGAGARRFFTERLAEMAEAAAKLAQGGAPRTEGAARTLADLVQRAQRGFGEASARVVVPAAPAAAPKLVAAPASAPVAAAANNGAPPAPEVIDGVEHIRGKQLTLLYEGKKCIHARFCVTGAPRVFLANVKGPWINPDAMSVESLVEIAHACPSGAIRYQRGDGASEEQAPPVNLLAVREAGPYAVRGDLRVDGRSGFFRATLCRCGASKNKPYCDGSHHEVNFAASGEPATGQADMLPVRDGALQIDPELDGPLQVRGNLEITSGTGRVVARIQQARLCRCGGSANKPFCDGTHARIGFRSS